MFEKPHHSPVEIFLELRHFYCLILGLKLQTDIYWPRNIFGRIN